MGGHVRSDSGSDLPPNEREAWITSVAAAIRKALDDPTVRREIVAVLTGEDERRQRRLDQLACELEGEELTVRLGSDDANSSLEHDP
jgi:vacuolar-type H+-ATPase subunit E/Vma4